MNIKGSTGISFNYDSADRCHNIIAPIAIRRLRMSIASANRFNKITLELDERISCIKFQYSSLIWNWSHTFFWCTRGVTPNQSSSVYATQISIFSCYSDIVLSANMRLRSTFLLQRPEYFERTRTIPCPLYCYVISPYGTMYNISQEICTRF